jgi:transcriptional regulator with XRE-family HTH domain
MSERERDSDTFGPNLRRLRMKRGIPLEQIAARTKVNVALWTAMERNDLSRWPTGIYARAFMREYASAIGEDPESTVDEFCRWFAQGDRRAEPTIRGQAEIVGHQNLVWQDEAPPHVSDGDRRGSSLKTQVLAPARPSSGPLTAFAQMFMRITRLPR